ncbi:CYTH domain-containing protein [Rummeliibacillus suwonensis]|uniref:CYTH domain-containing protein n=1 Tax=Rummeliibacillus suwonensis TaxID=1306154 RepID=UPI002897F6C0|nr:CYTH domain-containing protein [Rummeliibacillus suwonensis]
MTQQLEIEFKNMLTQAEFTHLCICFKITDQHFHAQTNHYFDTQNFDLKKLQSGLRIREVQNRFECTLKEPATGIGLIETTDILSKSHVQSILDGHSVFHANEVSKRLQSLKIDPNDLRILGTLLTERAEIEYEGGLLVFDHSHYADTDDYELEYEVSNEKAGKAIFESFLTQYSIPRRPADKKVARFMSAVNKK